MKQADELGGVLASVETQVSCKTPVMEAEHALDDTTALSFFDNLIPKLKEHRRFKIFKDDEFSIADFTTIQKVRELEREIQAMKLPKVKEDL